MKQYILKSKPVEALKWTGDNFEEFERGFGDVVLVEKYGCGEGEAVVLINPERKECPVTVHKGQYAVRDHKGEVRRLQMGYFERCYEEVTHS